MARGASLHCASAVGILWRWQWNESNHKGTRNTKEVGRESMRIGNDSGKRVGSRLRCLQSTFDAIAIPRYARNLRKSSARDFLLIFRRIDHNPSQAPVERLYLFINIRDAFSKARDAAGVEIG